MEYRTASYAAAGIYPKEFPGLTALVLSARSRFHTLFEAALEQRDNLDTLLERQGLSDVQRALIEAEREKAQANLDTIVSAGTNCYAAPQKCPELSEALVLKPVDMAVAAPPEMPELSFRLHSLARGIWPRADSTAEMRRPAGTVALPEGRCPQWIEAINGHCDINPFVHDVAARTRTDISEVAILKGSALSKVELWFEDWKVDEVDLSGPSPIPTKNLPEGARMLVLSSTRPTPGWVDLRLARTVALMSSHNTRAAEGTAYLLVRDAFGRQIRFDLAYLKMTCSRINNRSDSFTLVRHRWWGADDTATTLAGGEPFAFSRVVVTRHNNRTCQ